MAQDRNRHMTSEFGSWMKRCKKKKDLVTSLDEIWLKFKIYLHTPIWP